MKVRIRLTGPKRGPAKGSRLRGNDWISLLGLLALVALSLQPYRLKSEIAEKVQTVPGGPEESISLVRLFAQNATADVRPHYPYSVVPGGLASAKEALRAAHADRATASHYAGIVLADLRPETAVAGRAVHVSYRKDGLIWWTRKKLRLAAGELLLTDGRHEIRGRCGNRVSETAQSPTRPDEPGEAEFNRPATPVQSPRRPVAEPVPSAVTAGLTNQVSWLATSIPLDGPGPSSYAVLSLEPSQKDPGLSVETRPLIGGAPGPVMPAVLTNPAVPAPVRLPVSPAPRTPPPIQTELPAPDLVSPPLDERIQPPEVLVPGTPTPGGEPGQPTPPLDPTEPPGLPPDPGKPGGPEDPWPPPDPPPGNPEPPFPPPPPNPNPPEVPEPGTWMLCLAGVAGLAIQRRRRNRSVQLSRSGEN